MPLRGVLGSDLVGISRTGRSSTIRCRKDDPILLVPAIQPDVALFHARWADEAGNVWIGRRKELATIAHASRACYVTYEELRPGDMLEDELLAPGVLSSVYVSGVAPAPRGAWPLAVPELYGIDDAHLRAIREGGEDARRVPALPGRIRMEPYAKEELLACVHRAPDRRRGPRRRSARPRRFRRRALFCCKACTTDAADFPAAQAQRQSVHRRLARAVRPRRAGAHRRLLPRRRADRRRGEHQPGAGRGQALSGLLRLGVHVLRRAAGRSCSARSIRGACWCRRSISSPRPAGARRRSSAAAGRRRCSPARRCSRGRRTSAASGWRACIPGVSAEEIRENTGFDYDAAQQTHRQRRRPGAAELALLRGAGRERNRRELPGICAPGWKNPCLMVLRASCRR